MVPKPRLLDYCTQHEIQTRIKTSSTVQKRANKIESNEELVVLTSLLDRDSEKSDCVAIVKNTCAHPNQSTPTHAYMSKVFRIIIIHR